MLISAIIICLTPKRIQMRVRKITKILQVTSFIFYFSVAGKAGTGFIKI